MPKIFLKPNSPEFAEEEINHNDTHRCDMPYCQDDAHHKAPKNRGLNEYYWFCLDHVQEYNKAWNFFEGMSNSEVQEHMINSIYGDRPTWRYDVEGGLEDTLREKAWKTYDPSSEEKPQDNRAQDYSWQQNRNTPEFEAMAIMGLEPPLMLDDVRARYKELVKKHHPDRNKGCEKSEELLKTINMAYTILKLAYVKFEDLPDRT